MAKSYKDLEVYQLSMSLFIRAHRFSFKLPKYETYELGGQIRGLADSVNSNIVEGYGRRRYKKEFIKFLVYSHSSNDETQVHLLKIKTLYPDLANETEQLLKEYDSLGSKLFKFIEYVENNWRT